MIDTPDRAGDEGASGTMTSGEGPGADELSCAPTPARLLVFGDSILDCDWESSEGCSASDIHAWLQAHVAAEISYENFAVAGAKTTNVPTSQMPQAAVGRPGHALVLIGIGGNDLSPALLKPDDEVAAFYEEVRVELDQRWAEMLAFLDDEANFPDGVTIVVDNQYNPFDDCTAEPYAFMSPVKTELLGQFNAELEALASSRENMHIVDLYAAFLGHAHHYDTPSCPHYAPGSEYWMMGGSDLVHPNARGYEQVASEVIGVLGTLYGGCA